MNLKHVMLVFGLLLAFDFLLEGCGYSQPPTPVLEPEGIETILVEEIEVEAIEDTWESIEIQTW